LAVPCGSHRRDVAAHAWLTGGPGARRAGGCRSARRPVPCARPARQRTCRRSPARRCRCAPRPRAGRPAAAASRPAEGPGPAPRRTAAGRRREVVKAAPADGRAQAAQGERQRAHVRAQERHIAVFGSGSRKSDLGQVDAGPASRTGRGGPPRCPARSPPPGRGRGRAASCRRAPRPAPVRAATGATAGTSRRCTGRPRRRSCSKAPGAARRRSPTVTATVRLACCC
jgi:hypothetical protein